MSHVAGKVAIVTGAAQGLGAGFARALADAGATVVTCDVQPGTDATVDVAQPDQVRRFVDDVVAQHGPIGILVNNAGICRISDPLDAWEKALDDFDVQVGTNLKGEYLMGRAVFPSMVAGGGGHVVNIATDHICRPPDFPYTGGSLDVYDATKWALLGLTRGWANALGRKGIRVNALSMGATDSGMLRSFTKAVTGAEPTEEVVASWMRPEQLGALLLELLEEGPDGRTGENIPIIVGRPIVLPPRAS
jgi:NAD(P)-dependent dehydrogenase (short-subunit alcohol dehydrogenase family)